MDDGDQYLSNGYPFNVIWRPFIFQFFGEQLFLGEILKSITLVLLVTNDKALRVLQEIVAR